jgi:hypothetical protein
LSLTLRAEQTGNKVLRGIFGYNGNETGGNWRKLRNEELHDLYSSPYIIIRITSRSRHVVYMEQKCLQRFCGEVKEQ